MSSADSPRWPDPEELAAAARRAADEPPRLLAALPVLDPGAWLRSLATAAFVRATRRRLPEAEGQRTRVALLSSFTVDHLVPFVDLQCRNLGLVPEIYVAPFGSWIREMVDEGAGLRSFDPHVVFLSVAIDDLMPELSGAPAPKELAAAGDQALERVASAAEQFRLWSREPLVVHGFHSAF